MATTGHGKPRWWPRSGAPLSFRLPLSLRIKLSLRRELAQADSLDKVVSWDLEELTPNFGSTMGFLHGLRQITKSLCSLSVQTR